MKSAIIIEKRRDKIPPFSLVPIICFVRKFDVFRLECNGATLFNLLKNEKATKLLPCCFYLCVYIIYSSVSLLFHLTKEE